MKFEESIKKYALEYARENTIVQRGEIVETLWGDWKKPHKVKINKIGAALSIQSWDILKNGGRKYKKTRPSFAMFYYALRLKADGGQKDEDGRGIVLTNLRKMDGKTWVETDEVLNYAAYHWSLSKET